MKHVLKALNKELKSLYEEKENTDDIIFDLRNERSSLQNEMSSLQNEVKRLQDEKRVLMLQIESLTENK
jgi:peptidoglycan hydrolase CwlO-like protein